MHSYDLSASIAIKAGGDTNAASALKDHGKHPKVNANNLALATEDTPHECSYCGHVETQGYIVIENPSSKFTNLIDLKNDRNTLCSNCYILCRSGPKYLRDAKISVATESGFFSLAKDSESYYFWHNPVPTPFVATRFTTQQAHVYWRTKPSFSNDAFTYNFNNQEFFVVKSRVNQALEIVIELKNQTMDLILKASESVPLAQMNLTTTRLALLKNRESSILAGNYKFVRELTDSHMGQIAPWALTTVKALIESQAFSTSAQHLYSQLLSLQSKLTQLNNGELWWLYLLNKMQALESTQKLDKELKGISYQTMKITPKS
ncbi:hypothetical protein ACP3V3_02615 [Vibrio sp. PNB22_3_1]